MNPKLAEPGAGLGVFEMFFLNSIIKPFWLGRVTRANALAGLAQSHDAFLRLVAEVPKEQCTKRVLVPRPWFVEDSSRHWSAAMMCRHLGKVNLAIANVIENGIVAKAENLPSPKDRLAAVKPEVERNTQAELAEYLTSVEKIRSAMAKVGDADLSSRTLPHPWLGDITHLQWVWFLGRHIAIHTRQLRAMQKQL